MKESTLIRICIVGSLAGILALYFASSMIEAERVGAGEITGDYIGRKVTLSGTVGGVRRHESGHLFFEVSDGTGSMDVVMWEDKAEQLELSGIDLDRITEGTGIEVTGYVELYRGGLQVVL